MKIKLIILLLALYGLSCSTILNRNSIKVEASSNVDKSKIRIEHGIAATSISRKTDQYIFDNRSGYTDVFKNGMSKEILNGYGENDFLITYNDSLYCIFKQFKTNWRNQHSYEFRMTNKESAYFIEVNIQGENKLNFKAPLIPIRKAYAHYENRLRKNYYLGPIDCLEDISNYKNESNEYVTKDGKFYQKVSDDSNFILTCTNDGEMYLRLIRTKIDLETIKQKGQFWIDKNNVFGNYETSDGEMPYLIKVADVNTFQNFGNSIYGKDKDNIYDTRHGIIEQADLKSFTPLYQKGRTSTAFGRDKNNYFFWDETVEDTTELKQRFEIK